MISVEECRNMSAKGRQRRSSDPYFARRKSINDPILDRNEEFTPESDGLTFVETNRLRVILDILYYIRLRFAKFSSSTSSIEEDTIFGWALR